MRKDAAQLHTGRVLIRKEKTMTRKELMELEPGTMLYNGHTEGEIKMDGKIKVIEVWIPIDRMSDWSRYFDERPDNWSIL